KAPVYERLYTVTGRIPLPGRSCFAPGRPQQRSRAKSPTPKHSSTMNTLKNNVRLIGNLGADPEVREVAKGRKVARLSVATNERYRNAEGAQVTDTQWHTVVAWGRTAEQVEMLLRKGTQV